MADADQRGGGNSNNSGTSGRGSPGTATTTTTTTSSHFNNNRNHNNQQCAQMESITHQLQNAGLYASQAYLLQQQQHQFELEQQFQVQALLQQQQQSAQAFAGMPYLDSPGNNQRGGGEQDMDMVGMLPMTWPQSSRLSSGSSSERWTFDQLGPNGGGGGGSGFSEMQSGEQVFFTPMDFPLAMNSAESMKAQASSASSTSRDRDFESDAMPQTQDMYGKLFQQSASQARTGPLSSASSMGTNFLNGLAPLSNQFEVNDSSGGSGEVKGKAIFQPMLDSTSLEPLDDTSLELLVSSLTQINSDPLSNQMNNDNDNGEMPSSAAAYTLGEYLRRSPDMSESVSDSSSVSSSSPRSSPQSRSATGASIRRQGSSRSSSVFASDAVGSRVIVTKKPKRIRRLCTQPNCGKRARSQGLCIAHGGGRRCAVDGCDKSNQGGNMCIKHGGGKRCSVSGCNKAAQTNSLCKAHGGGPRCQIDGCNKSSQGGGFCRSHGGGKRCAAEGCDKGTQRGDYCALHGGSRFCEVSGCRRNDRGGGLCAHHGGGKRCGIVNCARPCRRNGFCSTHLRLMGGGDDSA